MSYELQFKKKALREWNKLNPAVQSEFLTILERRLENPRVPKHSLRGDPNLYKIKLRSQGFRLVYHVDDGKLVVTVITAAHRDTVYKRF
ncbi:type II toxin-antitoxin system RelE/ParE family toxin [Marinobacter bryozoorum]|uniref:type II toxin-antitoxin system RelE family toxin n=1 Tax=Marinobacter bryozoorum TaxID=256324 RepID=UPI002003879C|nr:type II toxin-antitoxin system RelE/ParE family toxin [Marinobacter bryozoorum]MCK7545455.1 type II toxin-antitoxin system RelE/ParE family toxin [Marinobacter bryozoorum]